MSRISIYIIDDHKLVVDLYASLLGISDKFQVIGKAYDGIKALAEVEELRPDIILLDITMPDISGIELAKQIKAVHPSVKIIGVSMHSKLSYIKEMIKNGADGYLTKSSSAEEMMHGITEVYKGNNYICGEVKDLLTKNMLMPDEKEGDYGFDSLTRREIEIVNLVRLGKSSYEISDTLNIAKKTVEVHRHNILRKLNIHSSIELANLANNELL
jgi:DNA-binding NarL/FixJ family response regulator